MVKVAPRISMHNLLLAIEETTPSSTKEQLMRYRKERDKWIAEKAAVPGNQKLDFKTTKTMNNISLDKLF